MDSQTEISTGLPAKQRHEPFGRPTKYKPEYCQQLIDFFSVPTTIYEKITIKKKNGEEQIIEKPVANTLPLFQRFISNIGISRDTLSEWTHKYKDFSDSVKKAKELQEAHLIENGIKGRYDTAFGIFVAKNITTLRDKVDIDIQQDITIEVIGYDPDVLPPTKLGKGKKKQLPKAHIIDV